MFLLPFQTSALWKVQLDCFKISNDHTWSSCRFLFVGLLKALVRVKFNPRNTLKKNWVPFQRLLLFNNISAEFMHKCSWKMNYVELESLTHLLIRHEWYYALNLIKFYDATYIFWHYDLLTLLLFPSSFFSTFTPNFCYRKLLYAEDLKE